MYSQHHRHAESKWWLSSIRFSIHVAVATQNREWEHFPVKYEEPILRPLLGNNMNNRENDNASPQ